MEAQVIYSLTVTAIDAGDILSMLPSALARHTAQADGHRTIRDAMLLPRIGIQQIGDLITLYLAERVASVDLALWLRSCGRPYRIVVEAPVACVPIALAREGLQI